MFEFISAIYTFWNFIDDTNTIRKIFRVLRKYFSFIKWYIKNPEVRIKYVRIATKQKTNNTIETIYTELLNNNKLFGDGFIKTYNQLSFELINSKLNYRIVLDELNNLKENIKIETKFMPFYPLRKFKRLNELTNEFNEIAELITNPFKIKVSNHIIHIEIEIDTGNNTLQRFSKNNAEIIFKGKKIQINNFRGSEQGEFILYFVMKWIMEYRRIN
jgi:hypothetical protein